MCEVVPIQGAPWNTIFTSSIPHAIVLNTIAVIETPQVGATKNELWWCRSCLLVGRRKGRWTTPSSDEWTNEGIVGYTDARVNARIHWISTSEAPRNNSYLLPCIHIKERTSRVALARVISGSSSTHHAWGNFRLRISMSALDMLSTTTSCITFGVALLDFNMHNPKVTKSTPLVLESTKYLLGCQVELHFQNTVWMPTVVWSSKNHYLWYLCCSLDAP
jgi:hypothetical protein